MGILPVLSVFAIFRASKNVEKALRAFLFARRQTRMIESLREKAFAEFKRDLAKKEQKQLDDLTIWTLKPEPRPTWAAARAKLR